MATKKTRKPIKGAKKLGNVKPLSRQKYAKLNPIASPKTTISDFSF